MSPECNVIETSHKVKKKIFSEDTAFGVFQPQNDAYIGGNVASIAKSGRTTGT